MPADETVDDSFGDYERVRPEVSIALLSGVGILPAVGFGAQVGFGARWRFTRLTAEGRFLAMPDFAVSVDRRAVGILGLGLVSACFHTDYPGRSRYAFEGCMVGGAGRIAVIPESYPSTSYGSQEAHVFTAMAGARVAAVLQVAPSFYLKIFAEFDITPRPAHISFNGSRVWGDHNYEQGFLGIEYSHVTSQPARWLQPAVNQAASRP